MGFLDNITNTVASTVANVAEKKIEKDSVRIYRDCGKIPRDFEDIQVGDYNESDLEKKLLSSKIKGVKPGSNIKVELFNQADFKGEPYPIVYDRPADCLPTKWQGQTKSMKVIKLEGFGMSSFFNMGLLDVVIMVLLLVIAILLYKKY